MHERSSSWAVISIQGKQDYIKFIELGHSDIYEIQGFLRNFDRNVKIDSTPKVSAFIKCGRY